MGEYVGPRRARPFLCYVKARAKREDEERSWRLYMSEQAALTPQGKYMRQSWGEIVESSRRPVDGRSAEQIAADVIERAGLEVV